MCISRPKPSSHIAFIAFTPIIVSATFLMAAEPSEATRVEGKVSEMESDDDTDGETLMICSLMDGGRKLGVYGGGTLYEKASKYEEEVMEREAEASWEPVNADLAHAGLQPYVDNLSWKVTGGVPAKLHRRLDHPVIMA